MKRFIILITMAFTLCATNKAEAWNFSVANEDGKSIYYNRIEGTHTVEVTYGTTNFGATKLYYSGEVNIPTSVSYEGGLFSYSYRKECFQWLNRTYRCYNT